jgi:hypothetical protein
VDDVLVDAATKFATRRILRDFSALIDAPPPAAVG